MGKSYILLSLIIIFSILSGCGDAKSRPLATVDGKVITVGDFEKRLAKLPPYYKALASQRKKDFLEDMIAEQLLYKEALTNFGLNFGIAFQVMDDYRDLTSKTEDLGKPAGLDWQMGEVTLPFLLLPKLKRKKLLNSNTNLSLIKEALDKSGAFLKTRQFIEDYINRAKKSLRACENSCYKESLAGLTDFINPALSTTKISCPIRKGGVNLSTRFINKR